MKDVVYYNTVSPLLLSVLKVIMKAKEFKDFRLVGGTALSLFKGHRMSVNIDLFTDAIYESIDFKAIDNYLRNTYSYVDTSNNEIIGMGKSYYVGKSKNNCIKLDVYYTDDFIDNFKLIDGIRFASINEIIAMKMDVILRGGRKKDFWDIHELIPEYDLKQMISLHKKRYPYSHNLKALKNNFVNFTQANDYFNPICLKQKHWELIKLDLMDFAKQ
jgi:Nucleotidyl transferase AbiEii toxin, Type IV TA system